MHIGIGVGVGGFVIVAVAAMYFHYKRQKQHSLGLDSMFKTEESSARGIAAETLAAEATLDLKALRRMKTEPTDWGGKEHDEHYSLTPKPKMDKPIMHIAPVNSECQPLAINWNPDYEARVIREGQNVYNNPFNPKANL